MKSRNLFGVEGKLATRRLLEAHVIFPLFIVLMLGVVWVMSIRLIKMEGAAAERAAVDATRELIDIYEAQMIRNLGAIDQTLKTVKYAYEKKSQPVVLAELEKKGLLPPKLVFTVSIVNRDGEVMASTASGKASHVKRQGFFRLHQKLDFDDLNINLVKNPSGGTRVQFSRRLNSPNGSFNGIVMLSVDPAYFTSDYERSRLGDFGVIGLIASKGYFLAKRTGEQVTAGESAFSGSTKFDLSNVENESVPEVHFADTMPRYSSARRVFGYPLLVAVGLSKAEQLAEFEKLKRKYVWWSAIATALLILIGVIMSKLFWQLAQSQKRTRKNQETFYAASELSNDGVYVLRPEKDRNGNIVDFIIEDVNNRGAEIFGKTKEEVVGERLCDRLPQCRANGVLNGLINVYTTGAIHESEWQSSIASIKAEWLYRHAVPVEDGVVAIVRDITDRKKSEERITYMAHHDALTGLPNRTLLHDRIQQAILRAKRYDRNVSVVFVDLDHFKPINDTLGHRVGDHFLKILAERMVNCVRQTDTVVRLGGDEFVIVMGDQPKENDVLTSTLKKIHDTISEAVYFEGNKLNVTCSMGLARFPEDGEDTETLLLKADIAMYQAKAKGRNNYQYFVEGMDILDKALPTK